MENNTLVKICMAVNCNHKILSFTFNQGGLLTLLLLFFSNICVSHVRLD